MLRPENPIFVLTILHPQTGNYTTIGVTNDVKKVTNFLTITDNSARNVEVYNLNGDEGHVIMEYNELHEFLEDYK